MKGKSSLKEMMLKNSSGGFPVDGLLDELLDVLLDGLLDELLGELLVVVGS
jgi:hypothetical protein